jgi:hypothetical protein
MSSLLKFGGMTTFLILALILACEEWGDDSSTCSIPQTKQKKGMGVDDRPPRSSNQTHPPWLKIMLEYMVVELYTSFALNKSILELY